MSMNEFRKQNRRRLLQAAGAATAAYGLGALPFAALAASESAGKLKIGTIGSGRIGATLGSLWAKAGHEVMFSSLDLEHDKKLAASVGPNARAGTSREAAAFGDVLLLAVPYRAVPQVGKDLADVLKGKIVIDASNPIIARDGEIATWAREKGAGLASAELLPGARIVRAFNQLNNKVFLSQAHRAGEKVAVPLGGNDKEALAVVSRLVSDAGFDPVIVGSLAESKSFDSSAPIFLKTLTARELRVALKLP